MFVVVIWGLHLYSFFVTSCLHGWCPKRGYCKNVSWFYVRTQTHKMEWMMSKIDFRTKFGHEKEHVYGKEERIGNVFWNAIFAINSLLELTVINDGTHASVVLHPDLRDDTKSDNLSVTKASLHRPGPITRPAFSFYFFVKFSYHI